MASSPPNNNLNVPPKLLNFRMDAKSFDDICSTLAAKDKAVDARAAALDRREATMSQREAAMSERESALSKREWTLSARENGLPDPSELTKTMMRLPNEIAMPTTGQSAADNTITSSSQTAEETMAPILRDPNPGLARGALLSRDRLAASPTPAPGPPNNANLPPSSSDKAKRTYVYVGAPLVQDTPAAGVPEVYRRKEDLKEAAMKEIDRTHSYRRAKEVGASSKSSIAGAGAEGGGVFIIEDNGAEESDDLEPEEDTKAANAHEEAQAAGTLLKLGGKADGGEKIGREEASGEVGNGAGNTKLTEKQARKAVGQLLDAYQSRNPKDERSTEWE